jgi:hypothetical protein
MQVRLFSGEPGKLIPTVRLPVLPSALHARLLLPSARYVLFVPGRSRKHTWQLETHLARSLSLNSLSLSLPLNLVQKLNPTTPMEVLKRSLDASGLPVLWLAMPAVALEEPQQ